MYIKLKIIRVVYFIGHKNDHDRSAIIMWVFNQKKITTRKDVDAPHQL